MELIFGIIALVVALAGLAAALGHVGYLAMLNNAAKKRGISGESMATFVKSRWAVAGGTAAAAVIGVLLAISGSGFPDVLGLLLGAGAGIVAKQGLDATRKELRGGGDS